jgi:NAD dependent epimerase/dehydratase family enzyme
MGSGKQWLPWVHEDDVASAIRFLMLNDIVSGPFNIVAPESVTFREFFRTLAKVRHVPGVVPVPAFALKLGMGEMATAMLDSQRVVPRKLIDAGFEFRHDSLEDALRDLMKK